jgi:hypothetical protein
MRKLLLAALTVLLVISTHAQVTESETNLARLLVAKNSNAIGLQSGDLDNFIVSNTYKITGRPDLRMVYLQQSYKGIPVFNELQVLAFRQDYLVSNSGSRISGIEAKVNVTDGNPAITVLGAVSEALRDANLVALEQLIPVSITQDGRKYEFGKLGVAVENMTAELIWLPIDDTKKQVRLAWQVFLAPANSSDYWLVRVDAMNGSILGKQNLTITCNWDLKEHPVSDHVKDHIQRPVMSFVNKRATEPSWHFKPFLVNSASYRCIPYPNESPNHLGSPSAVVNNPWTMAPGNATSLGWHNDGNSDHDSTRGNNVWAAEDRLATNATIDRAAVSSTPLPDLTFDFTPNLTMAPTLTSPPNQQYGITNLFYWNNIMHDITYLYGFDEVGGNFQNNNQGRGGAGNDYVIADAQDGGGSNNANFATPVDGTRPRMQMYLWTAGTPDRDGDLDNSIIAHEFTHGISNRLTGGPSNSSCLGNAEHGGEGWSDYFALMVTTNWATATIADGANPRGIGTYAAGQSSAGSGIRNFMYSTNMAVNPLVYGTSIPSQVHNRGEYWCMALWEMTWEIIQVAGINPNLFNPSGGGGNAAALKLVIEGMRLQPCNPGFIDARNAILKADTLFFGAQYSCAIWKAFAKRGMGRNASQGSSGSVTDQTPSFLVDNGIFSITQSVQDVQEGNNVTYTNHVTAGACSPLVNAYVTDTLPTNVTWVSGGIYNAGNRTVTLGPVSLSSSQTQDLAFTVTVNNGTYFTPVEHINETVPNPAIPSSWTASSTSATVWTTSTQNNSAPHAFYAPNPTTLTDHRLATTASYTLNGTASSYTTLSFWHRWNTEDGWDGGVVEVSTDGGSTWADLGSKMITNGYNGSLGGGSGNVLAGRQAFTGLATSFIRTVVNLSSYAGQSIKIRFRFSSDDNTAPAGGGWFVDDIVLRTEPAVYIKSHLFNSSNVLLSTTDTMTRILPNATCVPVTISNQPSNITDCAGNTAAFSVNAAGSATINYQWQVNTGSGFNDITNAAPYSGATTSSLSIAGVTTGMNGYEYRVVISNLCGSLNSSSATLTVTAVASITTQPSNATICDGGNTGFSIVATGATAYQWQVNTGAGFTDIANNAVYGGATTATLSITGATSGMNNYEYRVVLNSCGPALNSGTARLTIASPAVITGEPAHSTVCTGANTSFTVVTSGAVVGYQWQVSTDGGTTFTNINGQTTPTLNLNAVGTSLNGNVYRVIVSGNCGSVNSVGAILQVNPTPTFTLGNIPASACVSDNAVTLTATGFTGTWSGNGVQGSQFVPSAAGVGSATITFSGTNNFGCSASQSATVVVNECPERHLLLSNPKSLIILPNPNNGDFRIWVRTDLYSRLNMRVYASDGRLISTEFFSGISYDMKVPVDLTRLPAGVYQLFLYNDEAGRLEKNSFKVVIVR